MGGEHISKSPKEAIQLPACFIPAAPLQAQQLMPFKFMHSSHQSLREYVPNLAHAVSGFVTVPLKDQHGVIASPVLSHAARSPHAAKSKPVLCTRNRGHLKVACKATKQGTAVRPCDLPTFRETTISKPFRKSEK